MRENKYMRSFGFIAAFTATLYLAAPALAWNATGHRVVAAIAYDRLTPQARAQVDAFLRKHPDFAALSGREAFLAASVWPDRIKGDRRFYDDTHPDAKPTPLLAGFPSMARHENWHYIDIPFSPDGTPLKPSKSPNALDQLQRILKILGPADAEASYDLPWLIHLTGDVHQPLHCTRRFLKSQPDGDQGGNLVFVTLGSGAGRTLHAFWDDIVGTDTGDASVNRLADGITADYIQQHGAHPRLARDPKKWIDEGFQLAKSEVYTFGTETGSREHPVGLPAGYETNARRVARAQLAVAGFRLADALNRKFK
jgi:hypothetical protein